jgi:hypothetical protein
MAPIWEVSWRISPLLMGFIGSWFCSSLTSILMKSWTPSDEKGSCAVELVALAAEVVELTGLVLISGPF